MTWSLTLAMLLSFVFAFFVWGVVPTVKSLVRIKIKELILEVLMDVLTVMFESVEGTKVMITKEQEVSK